MFVNLTDTIPLGVIIILAISLFYPGQRRRPEQSDPSRRKAWAASKTRTNPNPRFWFWGKR
jgi:hypothetical protein